MIEIREKYKAYLKVCHEYISHFQYDNDHVFDENQSVKWNREMVAQMNAEGSAKMRMHEEKKQKAYEDFISSVFDYVKKEFHVGDELASEIWSFCRGRSCTYEEALTMLDELSYLFGGSEDE